MADKAQTSFEKLYNIDVSGYIEKKNGLNYLSWANAIAEFKKVHPNMTYEVKKFENGLPYVYDENTGYMVFTSVTVDGLTNEMWLPVMDSANNAMKSKPYTIKTRYKEFPVQAATMFDINKTIMRCLTKNLAMFGLGLRVYNGEDLPETVEEQHFEPPKNKAKTEKPKEVTAEKSDKEIGEEIKKMLNKSEDELKADLKKLLMDTDSDTVAFLKWASERYKRDISNVDMMIGTELEDAIKVVNKTKKKKGDK